MPKFNDSERNFVTFTTTLHKTMEHLKFCDKAPHQFYARLTNLQTAGDGDGNDVCRTEQCWDGREEEQRTHGRNYPPPFIHSVTSATSYH